MGVTLLEHLCNFGQIHNRCWQILHISHVTMYVRTLQVSVCLVIAFSVDWIKLSLKLLCCISLNYLLGLLNNLLYSFSFSIRRGQGSHETPAQPFLKFKEDKARDSSHGV